MHPRLADVKVVLAQPQTYMNLSGRAVRGVTDFLKIYHSNTLVVYDDVAFPLGTVRLRVRGSSGGQKGVADVLSHLGKTSRFVRVRVGIGAPPDTVDRKDWVLKRFREEEKEAVARAMQRTIQCIDTVMEKGVAIAMNEYNRGDEEQGETQRGT